MKLCICGYERSGTTIIGLMMAKATGMSLLNDPPESYRTNLDILHKNGLNKKFAKQVRTHEIVKVPGFAAVLPQLKSQFGEFQTLYIMRDPRDAICSAIERTEKGPKVAHINLFWTPPLSGVPDEDMVLGMAGRWREYAMLAKSYEKQNNGKVYWLKYEFWWQDKIGALRLVTDALGLPFSKEGLRQMCDVQVNKNLNRGIPRNIAGPGRWKRDLSERDARRVEAICNVGGLMEEFGYL